ncbi:DNA polymerase iota [Erysiphe neolycopersici]|uniref:DNA polymerase iota n=1 Tax=Erysiphe neolycopersici TaxID=212602 RepID=A0A420I1M7_9PEZI|nr:DNA polymerase iota [Erysiphe neolycopersici]
MDHGTIPNILNLKQQRPKLPKRNDSRVILHFDYDCFYAAVFEKENPALKFVPLAVQQKQIIVTCNYAARRQGLRKLQHVTEAKKICPDVVIVLGEELGRFRDASKILYDFIRSFSWNGKVERLGFDEVFLDVTDIIDFNKNLLDTRELKNSFFQLNRQDPSIGFAYDATSFVGHQFPHLENSTLDSSIELSEKILMESLFLGSHLAQHIRFQLENETGYTSTVGISTSKLLSKLVGRLNKPCGQTTLVPPYENILSSDTSRQSSISKLIDCLDIGEIPGIGFKNSQRIREFVLSRPPKFDSGLIYGETKESVLVSNVRLHPRTSPEQLEKILGGPGKVRGVGGIVWGLLNGIDNSAVQQAKEVPTQISMENSYLNLNTLQEVFKELCILMNNLLNRMHVDLLENDENLENQAKKRWIAIPKTIRLSTRPRSPAKLDGSRNRSFNRFSKSCPLPSIALNIGVSNEFLAEKLVRETLMPLFKRLHPSSQGWNLCLLNVCVTNMTEVANRDGKTGRDISQMFQQRMHVSKKLKDDDNSSLLLSQSNYDVAIDKQSTASKASSAINENTKPPSKSFADFNASWEDSDEEIDFRETCCICGAIMPAFAMIAHERFHSKE